MKKILFILSAASISLTSCALDDNINPNEPVLNQTSPIQLLSAAETTTYDAQTTDIMALSNVWLNCWAGNEYYFAAPLNTEYQMNITTGFRNGIWNHNYLAMGNLANIVKHEQGAEYPHHVAIAKILLANSMQYMVDFYGDVPYSEAFLRIDNSTPKYDKGEDVYKALVIQLNEAIASLDASAKYKVGAEDVIFGGDTTEWKKLANTLKLRLLLRQSKVTDATIRTFVDAQLQSLSGASFITDDVTINPGYSAATEAQQNPLIREYGWLIYDDSANNTYGYRYIGDLSDHFAKLLVGTDANTTGVTDARGTIMYRSVSGTLKGIIQGGGKVTGATEASFSRLRWKYYNYSSETSGMDGYIMLKSESELLQAEAAELYPAIFSGGQAKFEQAVRSSFRFYYETFYGADYEVEVNGVEIPVGTYAENLAATYLTNLSTKPYGWNGSKGHIAAIQYQRMVALNLVKPQETYINYLKTGFPETPNALTAIYPNKPYRLLYPSSEYVANSANVPNISAADAFVKNQYTPFWNRN